MPRACCVRMMNAASFATCLHWGQMHRQRRMWFVVAVRASFVSIRCCPRLLN